MTTSRGVAGEPRQHASAGQTARRSFMELLRARWEVAGTLLCVGLDPELERLPETIRTGGDSAASREGNDGTQAGAKRIEQAILAFNTAIVDATADLVCAFKPNSAFYEAHGPAGLRALLRTIAYLHDREGYRSSPSAFSVNRSGAQVRAARAPPWRLCAAVRLHPHCAAYRILREAGSSSEMDGYLHGQQRQHEKAGAYQRDAPQRHNRRPRQKTIGVAEEWDSITITVAHRHVISP